MNEIVSTVFNQADASVIFYLGAFLALLGALLAERIFRAQSVPLFAGLAATLMLSVLFFVARLSHLASSTNYLAIISRDPQFTLAFLAMFSIFWLIAVVSRSQVMEPRQARQIFRWWLAGLMMTVIILFGQGIMSDRLSVVFVLGDAATQITFGTICGIFLMATAVSGFRLWRTRHAVWAWITAASLASTTASLIFYQSSLLPHDALLAYACLGTASVFVVFGLFADQARFVKLESELRRGLLDSSIRLENEARHQATILSFAREAVVHVDRDERITYHTPSFCALLQTTSEKCLNQKLDDVLPSEWASDLAPALQEARRGRTFQTDMLLRHGDAKRLFQVYATPLRDDKERITGVHLALFDLAEHGRREVSLETQIQAASADLQIFRRVVELASEAIYLTDTSHQIIYANEATERLTGFTRVELLGHGPLHFRAPTTARESHDEIVRKLAQGKRYRGEVASRRKDGTPFVSDVTVVPLGEAGDRAGAAGRHLWIEYDATERRRLENALRDSATAVKASTAAVAESRRYHESLLDAMRDLVLVVNQQGQCTFMNAAAREQLGYTPENFEIKKLPAFIVDMLRLDKDYGDAVKVEVRNHEAAIRAKSSELVSCSWQARPLFDAHGDRNGLIAIGRDVADLKQMQSTLADYQHHLEEKVRGRTAELQQRVDQLRQLMEIGEDIRLHADLDEIMQRIAVSISALGWQRVLVFIREAQQLRLVAASGFLRRHRSALKSVQRVGYDEVAMYFDERFRLSRSYFVDSTRLAPEAVLPYIPEGVSLPAENEWRERDSVLVPITMKDEIAGLFAVFSPSDGRRPETQQLCDLEILADDAAIAIANSRLLKSHRRSEHYARILADIAETFQSTRTIEQIVADMANVTTRAFGCSVVLAFREGEDRWLVAASPVVSPHALHLTDKNLSTLADALTGKKAVVVRKRRAELPLSSFGIAGTHAPSGAKAGSTEIALLMAPLFARGQKIGFMAHFDLDGKRFFNDTDIDFARDLAERTALTYENAQLFYETEKKARELERANEMVSDFLASTSHELRTPMQAILSMSDFLLRGLPGKLNEEQKRQIAIIQHSGRNLLALINDILDLSKIEAGKMEAAVELFDPQVLLRETAETILPLCREKNLRLHVDLAKDLPAQVTSDPALLRRVLTNLLGNAVKFTPPGRGEIHLIASMSQSDELTISVRDTGIGIAPEYHQKIFEPFQQIERSATRRYGGTGLGLAISQKILTLLGGTVEISSALGKGSTFTLRVPVGLKSSLRRVSRQAEKTDGAKKAARKSLLKRTRARVKGKPRILVVEDDENTRYAMQFLLENEGYQVDFADGGEQALLAAQHQKPQLILLDIMMPTMDGYQVSRMLKAQKQLAHIPVVALTARAMKGDREMALAAGCDDYLTKPFERTDILAVIERWLNN